MAIFDGTVLFLVGFSLNKESDTRFNFFRNCVNFCVIIVFAVFSSYTIWMCSPVFSDMAIYLIPGVTSNYMVCASYFYMFRRRSFFRFYDRMVGLEEITVENEKDLLKESLRGIPLISKIFFFTNGATGLWTAFAPGVINIINLYREKEVFDWNLPFYLKSPIELSSSAAFVFVYLILAYAIILAGFLNYYDIIFFEQCLTLKGHFRIVQYRCHNLDFKATDYKPRFDQLVCDKLDELLLAVAEFRNGYAPIIFLFLVTSAIILCAILKSLADVSTQKWICIKFKKKNPSLIETFNG